MSSDATTSSGAAIGRRRFRAARWSALAVGVVAVVLVSVLATRQPAMMVEAKSPLVGRAAPAIVAKSFTGETVSLASYRGRWVLVNFFASWCNACQAEEPQLEQFLYSRPDGAKPEVIGVLYGDTEADGKSFQQSAGASWPSVVDPGGIVASNYGVGSLPHSFLVDPTGRVVASLLGPVTASGLDQAIQQESAGRA
ncbi:MAG: TlpA family protein disulfide reductase [Acidimicrobiales bacterium]